MNTSWFNYKNIIDPATGLGALSMAFVMILAALLTCIITTRLAERSHWVVGKLKFKIDETVIKYGLRIKNLLVWMMFSVLYASLVPGLKALMSTIVAGASITALVVGFAAKSSLANMISGLTIAIYRPIRIGDKISIEGEYSVVEDITLRHTIVRSWDYKRLIIPNSKLDDMTLINYSIIDPRIKCVVDLGVSYDTDIDFAREVILDEAHKCPYRDKNGEDEPYLRVRSHDDFSIGLRLYVWVLDIDDAWSGKFWLLENIKKRFDREGIEIPFPYRTVVYKNDLPAPRHKNDSDTKS
ncbi:MAG: mechanosensitive ion channel family protein [Desulfobacterium sp.]|nr:mechanosensitive ion channel family protein [Desulfobacterium sp.]MBU3950114.1 mechanosensitive ion channel family protein [Pseudomonadota bacterium]MBU4010172.1 mechanosensitive ion channel family protein [Pseudomonadota bacterium]MBU4036104.1 mechanosensitive ion channel family protein [Pseudomonadota bacterium]